MKGERLTVKKRQTRDITVLIVPLVYASRNRMLSRISPPYQLNVSSGAFLDAQRGMRQVTVPGCVGLLSGRVAAGEKASAK